MNHPEPNGDWTLGPPDLISRQAAAEATWVANHARDGLEGEGPEDERDARIRQAAYFRAERRGFTPGQELEDWLAAEQELCRPPGSAPSGPADPAPLRRS
jgi:hypothetical protein